MRRDVVRDVRLHGVERRIHVADVVLDLLRSAVCREGGVYVEGV